MMAIGEQAKKYDRNKFNKPPDFVFKASELHYICIDHLARSQIILALEFMYSWMYQTAVTKGRCIEPNNFFLS